MTKLSTFLSMKFAIESDLPETYIGDCTSVRLENHLVILSRQHSTGEKKELRLDPMVLDELLGWLQENDVIGLFDEQIRVRRGDNS